MKNILAFILVLLTLFLAYLAFASFHFNVVIKNTELAEVASTNMETSLLYLFGAAVSGVVAGCLFEAKPKGN